MPALRKCILMLQKSTKAIFSLIFVLAFISSCSAKAPVKRTDYLLGTIVSITVYDCDNGDRIIGECFEMVRELENKVSPADKSSVVSHLNNSALNCWINIDSEVYALIKDSMEYCIESEGAFDIGLGRIIDLWGIGTDGQAVPNLNELEPYMGFKCFEHIFLNDEQCSVLFDDGRVSINLGACAKGYAVNKTAEFLKEKGVKSALIDFGGSIYAIGDKNGKGFDIGIANPGNDNIGGVINNLSDISVVTSGDYQRYFEQNGIRYHHIIDSNTAFPAASGVRSVTIVCPDSFKGDCLSTAAFVLGVEKGKELLDKMNCGYVFFTDSGVIVSDSLRDSFNLIYDD